jgi:hypothetical protein
MAPHTDWAWLSRVAVRLKQRVQPVRSKRDRLVEADELFAFGMQTMARAEATDVADWRQAQHYRDGLMIALLAARPLRRRNFTAIEIGRHLRSSGCRWRREPAQRWRTAVPGRFPGG